MNYDPDLSTRQQRKRTEFDQSCSWTLATLFDRTCAES